MRRSLALISASAALALGLTACVGPPEPDWRALEPEANAFVESGTRSPDSLGGGSFRARRDDAGPDDLSDDDDARLMLGYASDVRIDAVTMACFGGGEARLGLSTRSGSTWTGQGTALTVVCDGTQHGVPIDAPVQGVNAIQLSGVIADGPGGIVAGVVRGSTE
ncbi:hypothetical protein OVN20_06590 [Microcella daejeonensis]|uniref:hypothetical protein n=1 Tax=Microcella daejeonensis TaxID=2994971 RepID=UPI002271B98C|nr:hypothetical protein [Microcella daejeonensis]WAB85208.1 hypothetical protein OVN20_06590 [Microcella daejeonensis]